VTHRDKDVEAPFRQQRAATSHDTAVGVIELEHAAVRDRLSDFLDGTLSPGEQERIRQHLDLCEPCRAFRNTLGRTIEVLGALPRRRLPDEAKRRILDQLKVTAEHP
jgi:predicted anti-sigma-YlaC factor YlaD